MWHQWRALLLLLCFATSASFSSFSFRPQSIPKKYANNFRTSSATRLIFDIQCQLAEGLPSISYWNLHASTERVGLGVLERVLGVAGSGKCRVSRVRQTNLQHLRFVRVYRGEGGQGLMGPRAAYCLAIYASHKSDTEPRRGSACDVKVSTDVIVLWLTSLIMWGTENTSKYQKYTRNILHIQLLYYSTLFADLAHFQR